MCYTVGRARDSDSRPSLLIALMADGGVQGRDPTKKSQEKIAGDSNGKRAWVEGADIRSVSNRLSVPAWTCSGMQVAIG